MLDLTPAVLVERYLLFVPVYAGTDDDEECRVWASIYYKNNAGTRVYIYITAVVLLCLLYAALALVVCCVLCGKCGGRSSLQFNPRNGNAHRNGQEEGNVGCGVWGTFSRRTPGKLT